MSDGLDDRLREMLLDDFWITGHYSRNEFAFQCKKCGKKSILTRMALVDSTRIDMNHECNVLENI